MATPLQHVLSKSTFLYGCQCTKRLYLHKFKPELKNPVEEEEDGMSIFSNGADVGKLAQQLFPNGADASPPDTYSYHLSVTKTKELILSGAEVIYEAAFIFDGLLCAIDILVKKNGAWYAYEVKGTTKVKPQHIDDALFQYFVITNSGLTLKDISIIYLNNKYVRRGALDVQQLFTIESIHDEVKAKQKFIADKAVELRGVIGAKTEPQIAIGTHCQKPYPCDFTDYCGPIINAISSEVTGKKYIEVQSINEFLSEWEFPFYFFDFETIMPAIPDFDESRPFQQIPFQYSLHIKRTKEVGLEHFEFLGDGVSDPRENLIQSLIDKLEEKGSIITWNKTFECTVLKGLARDFPKYQNAINSILDRVVDLMVPFKKWYDHPEFYGSYSLKVVLPVMVPDLSYESLEIKEGGTASGVYYQLRDQTEDIQSKQRVHLLEYCKLDTLAMVRLLEQLYLDISS
jgi:hypothetical protein